MDAEGGGGGTGRSIVRNVKGPCVSDLQEYDVVLLFLDAH
jgi:ribosomal protein S28E/S33